MAISSLERTDE